MNWNSAVTRSDAITQDFCTLVMTSFIKFMLLINCLNPLTLSFSTIRYYFSENASSEILTFYYNWFFVNTAFACHLRSEELTEMNLPLKTVPTPFWSRFSTHLPPQINYGMIATQYRGVSSKFSTVSDTAKGTHTGTRTMKINSVAMSLLVRNTPNLWECTNLYQFFGTNSNHDATSLI